MKAVEFEGQNLILQPPAGWDQGDAPVGKLPVLRITNGNVTTLTSYWRPSKQDLEELNSGGHIAVTILGDRQPPVAVTVDRVEEKP